MDRGRGKKGGERRLEEEYGRRRNDWGIKFFCDGWVGLWHDSGVSASHLLSAFCTLPNITSLRLWDWLMASIHLFPSRITFWQHIHVREQSSKMVTIIQQLVYKFASFTANSTVFLTSQHNWQICCDNLLYHDKHVLLASPGCGKTR